MWQPDLHLVDRGLAEIVNLVALLEGAGAAPTLQDMHPGETPGPEVSETLDIRVKTVLDTISVSTKQWRSTGASIRHSHEVVEKRFSLAYEELNTDTRPEGFMQRPEMSQLIERLKTMDPKLAHCAVLYGLFESNRVCKIQPKRDAPVCPIDVLASTAIFVANYTSIPRLRVSSC